MAQWEEDDRRGVGPRPSILEIEDWAADFRRLLGMFDELEIKPSKALAVLTVDYNVQVQFCKPPEGQGMQRGQTLYLGDVPSSELEDLIAHEISHWYLSRRGTQPALQEAIMEDFLICWRMPRNVIDEEVEKAGFTEAMLPLLDFYRHVAHPFDLLVRAAGICHVGLLVFDPQEGFLFVGSGVYEVNLAIDEREAFYWVRYCLRRDAMHHDPRGFSVVPLEVDDVRLCVFVVDLTRQSWAAE